MTAEEVRMECLREAVKVCTTPITAKGQDTVALAKAFTNFVLDLEDEEPWEWQGKDEEPIDDFDPNEDNELKHAVHAYDDEGKEL